LENIMRFGLRAQMRDFDAGLGFRRYSGEGKSV
jgi:hypothetical protein